MKYILLVLMLLGAADFILSIVTEAMPHQENVNATKEIYNAVDVNKTSMPRVECLCDDNNLCTADACASGQCVYEEIKCPDSKLTCADGFIATCKTPCSNGACSECLPSCAGHDAPQVTTVTPITTPAQCAPKWQCNVWDSCINDRQNRTCDDANDCSAARTEIQDCLSLNHVIFSEVLYDTPGTESDEEWVSLYNPTASIVNMVNWSITDNSGPWKFTSALNAKSTLIIARDAEGFRNLTGCSADISGFTRGLNNNGDYLALKNGNSNEIDFVAWSKGYNNSHPSWNITAKEGQVIKRIFLTVDTDSAADWAAATAKPCP